MAGPARGEARERVAAWIAGGGEPIAGFTRMVREMRAAGSADFATLSVAAQTMRRMLKR